MLRRSLFVLLAMGASVISSNADAASGGITFAQINCTGVAVVRSEVGQLQIVKVEPNIPGCLGPAASSTTKSVSESSSTGTSDISNTQAQEDAPSQQTTAKNPVYDAKKNGPLLDITSEQIGKYRVERMKEQGIKYVNPVRSVRMRKAATKKSETTAYLMKNDAIVVSQTGTGWTKAQGAEVKLLDEQENVVAPNTDGKAKGYVATRFVRDPNPSDLVRIKQADQAYWSDIAHVKVAHLVNVREHAWYGSKIKFVLSDKTPLYVVSTVDNWSEVISDDRTIHGYIRSDFLVIEKAQRVEPKPLLK